MKLFCLDTQIQPSLRSQSFRYERASNLIFMDQNGRPWSGADFRDFSLIERSGRGWFHEQCCKTQLGILFIYSNVLMFYICFNIVCRGVVSHFHKTKGEEVETPKWKDCICIKKGSKGRVYIRNIVTFRPLSVFWTLFLLLRADIWKSKIYMHLFHESLWKPVSIQQVNERPKHFFLKK